MNSNRLPLVSFVTGERMTVIRVLIGGRCGAGAARPAHRSDPVREHRNHRRGREWIGSRRTGESLKPDVVLMDLEMPVMDGYESTRQIKALPPCRVVALTVHDYESARAEAHRSGVDAFLVKGAPVKPSFKPFLKKE